MSKNKHRHHKHRNISKDTSNLDSEPHLGNFPTCRVTVESHLHADPVPKEEEWKDVALHDRITICLTIGAIIVASVGAVIYYFQLQAARTQATAANNAALAANQSLGAIQDQFKIAQRPYMSILGVRTIEPKEGKPSKLIPGKPVFVTITFKNIGKVSCFRSCDSSPSIIFLECFCL
jgi:hypothetical protein